MTIDDIEVSGANDAVDNARPDQPEVQEADQEQQQDNSGEGSAETAEGEKVKKPKIGGWQRKLNKLERENAELKEKLNQNAPAVPTEKPNLDAYETYDQYLDALADWKVEQKLQEKAEKDTKAQQAQAEQAKQDAWIDRIEALDDSYNDYEEVVLNGFRGVQIRDDVFEAIQESDVGPQLAYYLAKNPDVLARVNDPRKSVLTLAKEIAQLEGQVAVKPEAKRASKLPAPISPIRDSAASTVDLHDLDTEAYLAQRLNRKR